jgi:hypothetical protein
MTSRAGIESLNGEEQFEQLFVVLFSLTLLQREQIKS